MSILADRLARIYTRSLALYPRNFRSEFADEAAAVFRLGLKDADREGTFGLVRYAARELYDLPLVLLALHAREREKNTMQKKFTQWFIHAPGSWAEVLLACTPFLVLFVFSGAFSFKNVEVGIPDPLGLAMMGGLALFLVLLGIAGLLVRLPRWAMPYAGVLICTAVMLALMLAGVFNLFFPTYSPTPWWLRMASFGLIYLAALAAALALGVWLARRVTLTSPFFEQVQKDWTTLSFAMYGGAMVFILGMYEDTIWPGAYVLLTVIPLLLGTWFFLRGRSTRSRMAALAAAVTVAIGISLVANLRLMEYVSPVALRLGGLEVTRSTLSILLTWLMCLGMLFLPALVRRIPFAGRTKGQTA